MAGILYKVEREQAKIDAPVHTRAYIELLEAVARAAYDLYEVTPPVDEAEPEEDHPF